MARKEETFQGLNEEQLKALSEKDSLQLLTSRARRTMKRFDKNPQKMIALNEIRKAVKSKNEGKTAKKVRTHRRDLVVLPEMLGVTIAVHNGKAFEDVIVTQQMIGHFVGEFVQTRKRVQHGQAGIGASGGSRHVAKK
ncbi:MAG TPA: ribosomal protein S19 family protein [archaeon]|nr:ribosomal protein S19 family protein [archaeon]HLD81009.1 ribosomal protein S19 family protein [archaeon]